MIAKVYLVNAISSSQKNVTARINYESNLVIKKTYPLQFLEGVYGNSVRIYLQESSNSSTKESA